MSPIRDDFSSRMPRLSGDARACPSKVARRHDPASLFIQNELDEFIRIVARPQPVAIHLHNDRHTSPMDQATTEHSFAQWASFSLALDRELLHVYGEPAFHYFLDIERERSIRSARPCVLLRVT